MTKNIPKPLVLIILDGWGHREETEANAIAAANKPNWQQFMAGGTHTLVSGSGKCVGLPEGQMGNSEVGHLNMGAGRIVHQDLTRIDHAIETGEFFQNPVFLEAFNYAKANKKNVHILGLLSPGGVHSHEKHIFALLGLLAKLKLPNVFLHAFLDGRDTPPRSALASIDMLEAHCQQLKCGRIASLIGRYYAMDRDKRWDRVEQAYNLLVDGKALFQHQTARAGLEAAYERGENDEFVKATSIHAPGSQPASMQDGDVVVFMNFRADRARELTQSLIDPEFTGFKRNRFPKLGRFVCLAEYDSKFKAAVAFAPESLQNILAEYLSIKGYRQLRIAETEKYAHVTFFFNGGIETPYPGEDRVLIPSSRVATYDLHPEMSALEITERLVAEINKGKYDLIVCNFANPDMVGHTGNFAATVQAIEFIDKCLGKVYAALKEKGGEMLITADHGNAEQMFNFKTNQPHTAHTSDPVPFVYLGRPARVVKRDGKLSDIAPTILYLLGLSKPKEMTGQTLIELI